MHKSSTFCVLSERSSQISQCSFVRLCANQVAYVTKKITRMGMKDLPCIRTGKDADEDVPHTDSELKLGRLNVFVQFLVYC